MKKNEDDKVDNNDNNNKNDTNDDSNNNDDDANVVKRTDEDDDNDDDDDDNEDDDKLKQEKKHEKEKEKEKEEYGDIENAVLLAVRYINSTFYLKFYLNRSKVGGVLTDAINRYNAISKHKNKLNIKNVKVVLRGKTGSQFELDLTKTLSNQPNFNFEVGGGNWHRPNYPKQYKYYLFDLVVGNITLITLQIILQNILENCFRCFVLLISYFS